MAASFGLQSFTNHPVLQTGLITQRRVLPVPLGKQLRRRRWLFADQGIASTSPIATSSAEWKEQQHPQQQTAVIVQPEVVPDAPQSTTPATGGSHSNLNQNGTAAARLPPEGSTGHQAPGGSSGDGGGGQPSQPKKSGLLPRIVSGLTLGLVGGVIVLVGRLPFLATLILVTYQATQEYYGFITSKGITKGMTPPPPVVSALTTVLCTSIAILAYFYHGRSGTVLAVSAFLLLVLEVVAIKRPKFAQLASSVFGLFYCGWLPSFWVKLRMLSMAAPAVPFTGWLTTFTAWTVGLVATFTAAACVIAADTGAYFVGKNLGRTKLTDISPKKTVEGALGGLLSSVGVALALRQATQWPASPMGAAILGVLVFFSSLFGDLIESIMKRDAGMKDSGDLIPGHGGVLDRVDSYVFTGAVVFFYCAFMLPNFGLA